MCQCCCQCETADFCTSIFSTVSNMALCVVQGPEVSVWQRTCIRVLLEITVWPPVFSWTLMDVSRSRKWKRCFAETGLQNSAWQRNHTDTNPWVLVPGTCYLGLKPALPVCQPCRCDGRSIQALCKSHKFHLEIQRKEMLFYTPRIFLVSVPQAEELHVCFLKA